MAQLTDQELAGIAHDFYLSKLNIAEISQKYDLSRYLIAKALEDAENRGIVKIQITHRIKRNQQLEREFQKKFNLKEAFILQSSENKDEDAEAIVNFAAKQIETYLKNAKTIGISWGSTMRGIINDFDEKNLNQLYFVQLLGQAINANRRKNPLAQKAAEKLHVQSLSLPAPLYMLNSDLIMELKREPYFEVIETCYHNLDLLFTGIGTMQSIKVNQFLDRNYVPILFKDIPEEKVAGTIMGRPYDIDGHFFQNFEKHICGVSITDIMKTPIRFCVVRDQFKATALLGALRTGTLTHLVTNDVIANRVLQNMA
ncbi:sugar-binding transcriptional regulator [Lactobacillus kefiranofaciens]|uniref:DNA-binding transcriptional regulator LsrR, DeoR family n=1 Tax=Lactobacillus kefiranofaciens TaxID=267818 RepID=A0AAX3UFG1_9LACO|nr:sugar-binding domain-containing protein [Lactobacillus kefiranofaciens]AEG40435.1 Transcriptional regulator [Lactobacillus kefiranofaciens subsp. kefiranofaciens]KRL24447.1 ArsR family transcriptional regulator [Lactobacillus kefiranofaciens subsp. kefirgranum DSM 10550 = JCM 8572]KRM22170.1 ArsR family transcriptional regulator [Lactobacillus kefiranofaciens subsp. kefiranofaciens DSM 5016 = JCM 6985]MCJ2172371.1 DNA-binding transcriptional regulator [Lactobacillus kefiranofaciens]MCP93298